MLSYDAETGLIILIEGKHGLLIDILLSLDSQSLLWATERLSTVITIGRLEHSKVSIFADQYNASCRYGLQTPLKLPAVPSHVPSIEINQNLVLRAILLVPSPDLDLDLWNAVLTEEGSER